MLQDTNIDLLDQAIANLDPFYPDTNIKTWQEHYRIPGDAPKLLERQLLLAMGDCNGKLAEWRTALEKAATDAGNPIPTVLPIDNELDYEEAVFALAFGLLIPLLPSVVMDERAREEIAQLKLSPGPYFDRGNSRLGRIRADSLGLGHMQAVVI